MNTPKRFSIPRLMVAAGLLCATVGAEAAVELRGGCSAHASGGQPVPKVSNDGSCVGDAPQGGTGAQSTAASAGAVYDVRGSEGDLEFALRVGGGTFRYLLQPGDAPGTATSFATAALRYSDTLEVASATLPFGTEVTLAWSGTIQLTADLPQPHPLVDTELTLQAGFGLTGPSAQSFTMCRGPVDAPCDLMFDGDSASFSSLIGARVGDAIALSGSLNAYLLISVRSAEPYSSIGETARVDAAEAKTYLSPTSEDVFLLAQSGTDYVAPVPEPATYAQMLAGLVFVLVVGRRSIHRPGCASRSCGRSNRTVANTRSCADKCEFERESSRPRLHPPYVPSAR